LANPNERRATPDGGTRGAALRAVALMGPTGSGKSGMALPLCEAAGAAIVCCDSMQVYRHLDIGTAKASREDQARVPHALLDCCELPDAFSAARWAAMAADAIRSENDAGRVPLIVGGTGLYLRALVEGFSDIPPEKPGVREGLFRRLEAEGIEALHAELGAVDAKTAERLHATDTQRILRALAVYHSSGRALSEWLSRGPQAMPGNIPVFVLEVPRERLRERIAGRFHAMLGNGWLDEVHWLDDLHLPGTHPAMRAVGYRQLLAHVRGESSLEKAASEGITATRHYAKRQVTWFSNQTPDAVRGDADRLAPLIAGALATARKELHAS